MMMIAPLFLIALLLFHQSDTALSEAGALQKAGNTDEAITVLQRAATATPGDAAVHNMLGALLNRSGRYPEALTHAQAAVANAPDNPRYRLNLGIVLVEHGRFVEAVKAFDRALEQNPSFTYGYLERGSALLSLNRDAEARTQWAAARNSDPKLVWPDWYEGLHDFIDRRYENAIKRFDRVAAAEPEFAPAALWRNLARLRARMPLLDVPPRTEGWPAPLYRMLTGQLTLQQVLAVAEQDRITGDRRRTGEALFVAAEIAAAAGRVAEATSLYERASAVAAPRHAWKIAAERR